MSLTSPNRGYPLEKIEGGAGSMSYWVSTFDRVATRLGAVRTGAQDVKELPGVGKAVTAARTDAQELAASSAPQIAEAELLSSVLKSYADAHGAYAVPANRMIDEIEDAHAAWQTSAATANNAGQKALWTSRSGTDEEIAETNQDARDALAARDAAKRALDELWETYERLYGQWDEAYDAALSALAGGTGPVLTHDAKDLLDQLLAADDPSEVLRLWREHPELWDELMRSRPDVIGNLDGIPYEARATANYSRLKDLHDHVADLPEPLRSEINTLWREVVKNHGSLISFDADGSDQTTAAVWYGPFDASKVSVLVPGMMSVVTEMGEWGQSARDLNGGVGPDSATIVWYGYDSPNFAEELSQARAKDGAASLRSFLLGLDANLPHAETNVIAHSYGSTTAARAIGSQADGLGVDRFITVGSAGLPHDRNVLDNLESSSAPRIFVTQSPNDFWAPVGKATGTHHTRPSDLAGATEFDSDGGEDVHGKRLLPTPGHSAQDGANFPWQHTDGGYLQKGSESFYNLQQIVATGEPGTERGGKHSEEGYWDLVARGLSAPGMYGY